MPVKFLGQVSVYRDQRLPELVTPVGYAALIDAYRLAVPLPHLLSGIGVRHQVVTRAGWRIFTVRHTPEATFEGNLIFALKYEGLDLAVLKRLFLAVGEREIRDLIRRRPGRSDSRRIWFLYEWLLGRKLDLPDVEPRPYVDVVDTRLQFGVIGRNSLRHRVRNNLPGTVNFCPMVTRSDILSEFVGRDLRTRARIVVSQIRRDLVERAGAILLFREAKASYLIEGERPPQERIQRWSRVIAEAGQFALDETELFLVQRGVVGDRRFVKPGFRRQDAFVGEYDRDGRTPVPQAVSARHRDVASLVRGMIALDQGDRSELDPIVAAAVMAFGFLFIRPFEDGNGRFHRYLIQHVLQRRSFNPEGVHLPVSAAILDSLAGYHKAIDSFSSRLLAYVDWEPTAEGGLRVTNDTADFYRFFDATAQAEFLYDCVQTTIDYELPKECSRLQNFEGFRSGVEGIVEMPGRLVGVLFELLEQSQGRLPRQGREGEFARLTRREGMAIEDLYRRLILHPGWGSRAAGG
ncbi:MAG: Fic family protein [Alphaproteobacteria bacterium]|nr:Fic family protein [Alphaproteobacteria bacterium]